MRRIPGENAKRLQLQTEIRLGRQMNSYGVERPWRLTISDEASHMLILEVELTNEEIADLLANAGVRGAPAELIQSGLHGLTQETARRVMELPKDYSHRWSELQAQWKAELLEEGWVLDTEKRPNMHHRVVVDGTARYNVTVRRWVT
jgi:hypothetical protein